MANSGTLLRVLRSAVLGHSAEDVLRALRPPFPLPRSLIDVKLDSIDHIRMVQDLDLLAALGLANFTQHEVVLTEAGAELVDLLTEEASSVERMNAVLTALLNWVEAAPRQSLGDFLRRRARRPDRPSPRPTADDVADDWMGTACRPTCRQTPVTISAEPTLLIRTRRLRRPRIHLGPKRRQRQVVDRAAERLDRLPRRPWVVHQRHLHIGEHR